MPVIGGPRKFYKKFKFIVEIDGVAHAGFTKCEGLDAEVAQVKHREGGVLTEQKDAGLVVFSDLVLERGASADNDLHNWWLQVVNAAAERGQTDLQYKRSLDIVQLDRDGTILKRWSCFEAWPTKFTAGSWDNNADENVIEAMTLSYRFFEKTFG